MIKCPRPGLAVCALDTVRLYQTKQVKSERDCVEVACGVQRLRGSEHKKVSFPDAGARTARS